MLDIGAMGADEHDQQALLAAEVIAPHDVAGDHVAQLKIRGFGAQLELHG